LRVAFLIYRGNPRCGGQGVYTAYLTRELAALGCEVEVFSGPPYPELADGVAFTKVPSLDLYREPDPFRVPRLSEYRDLVDVLEFAVMATGGFPEPLTFSLRAASLLRKRARDFDVVHDNQCLGYGLLAIRAAGLPVVATIHHPITVDRQLDLMHAEGLLKRLSVRRWYGFFRMQRRVARRLDAIVTVSQNSASDISTVYGIDRERISVVPVGVDHTVFRPLPEVRRVPGRIVSTASADVPMKGLVPLIEAVAKVRTERPDAELFVVGKPRKGSASVKAIERLGLGDSVKFVSGLSTADLVRLYAEAEVAVVPSLYEGFSLPAIEAMACGVPLVATTGGAIPEVVGQDGASALLVSPNDPDALASAILKVLDSPGLRESLSRAGRERVLSLYTWRECAKGTLRCYEEVLASRC
jgi:glycosyltransferase involved in cell wall biosynthesis